MYPDAGVPPAEVLELLVPHEVVQIETSKLTQNWAIIYLILFEFTGRYISWLCYNVLFLTVFLFFWARKKKNTFKNIHWQLKEITWPVKKCKIDKKWFYILSVFFQSLKARETMTLATYQQVVQDLADAVAARAAAVASKTGVLEWRRNCSSCRCWWLSFSLSFNIISPGNFFSQSELAFFCCDIISVDCFFHDNVCFFCRKNIAFQKTSILSLPEKRRKRTTDQNWALMRRRRIYNKS